MTGASHRNHVNIKLIKPGPGREWGWEGGPNEQRRVTPSSLRILRCPICLAVIYISNDYMGVFSVAGWDGSFFKVPHLCELPATQSPGWSPLGLPWGRGELLAVYRFIKQRAGMSPASIC